MKVYSNGHELIAIANLFRIRIHIFTFTDAHGNWNIIHPDPEFKTSVELPTNWAQQCVHYDLLVSDNSRLAEIDPHPHSRVLEVQPLDVDVVKHVKEWQKVTSKKKTSKIDATNDEKLLQEENKTADISVTKNIDEVEEVFALFDSKKNGYKRSGPQISAENRADKN